VDVFNTLGGSSASRSPTGAASSAAYTGALAVLRSIRQFPRSRWVENRLKFFLLRPYVPPQTAIASVVVARFTFSAAKAIFILGWIAMTMSLIHLEVGSQSCCLPDSWRHLGGIGATPSASVWRQCDHCLLKVPCSQSNNRSELTARYSHRDVDGGVALDGRVFSLRFSAAPILAARGMLLRRLFSGSPSE
jgi:hypothetical protein